MVGGGLWPKDRFGQLLWLSTMRACLLEMLVWFWFNSPAGESLCLLQSASPQGAALNPLWCLPAHFVTFSSFIYSVQSFGCSFSAFSVMGGVAEGGRLTKLLWCVCCKQWRWSLWLCGVHCTWSTRMLSCFCSLVCSFWGKKMKLELMKSLGTHKHIVV